jgi:hypothetical protein
MAVILTMLDATLNAILVVTATLRVIVGVLQGVVIFQSRERHKR